MSLSLDELQNVVLLFSNPVWAGQNTIPSTIIRNLTALSSQLAYSADYYGNMTVLSSGFAETQNGLIQGLLYVPDLPNLDECHTLERAYVPTAAVRQTNLPPTNYNLIALAPWFNDNCSEAYLDSARLDPLRAFIFYHPSTPTPNPPPANSPVWNMNDGGEWKSRYHYPIFAVSGFVGTEMMEQLSLYSGNLTQVPFGDNISALYGPDPSDYVRIWTELSVSTSTSLPSMWVFILVILAVLLLVVTSTCFFIQLTWRRRRLSLRRRVINGQVNLEAMGIKRLTVPLSHIEKFPLFTYSYEPDLTSPPSSPTSTRPPRRTKTTRTRRSSRGASDSIATTAVTAKTHAVSEDGIRSPTAASVARSELDYQPSCHICLEDYQNRVTIIRELPCGHIYHLDCIDEFLSQNSSLCPQCKVSMLPKGYCPQITNGMVRRERATRRLRDRIVVVELSDAESTHRRIHSRGSSAKKRIFRMSQNPPLPLPPPPQEQRTDAGPQAEETGVRPEEAGTQTQENTEAKDFASATRQRRMRELAGPDLGSDDGRSSTWHKIGRNMFPGFR